MAASRGWSVITPAASLVRIATAPEITPTGLTEVEAKRRLETRGELPRRRSSRSYASIIRANTLTIPNGILLVFGVLTIAFASWRDALFLGILVSNVVIGSFQEVRSKRALDRLAALVAPEAVVVRDGVDRRVPVDQVVAGDLVRLSAGDQVVADGRILSADGLALDESNLTGESELAVRGSRDPVWSGSFAVEGNALFEATAVGPDSRAERLTATARAFRHPRSPLERANDRLLLWLVALSVPVAIGLTISVFAHPETATQARAGADGRHRQPRPRGIDPVDQRDRRGVRFQDGSAGGARAAAQRDRVAGFGRHRLHRQDRHADRADAARGCGVCRRPARKSRQWPASLRATRPARRRAT